MPLKPIQLSISQRIVRCTYFLFIVLMLLLGACSAHRKIVHKNRPNIPSAEPSVADREAERNNKKIREQAEKPAGGYINYTALTYIDRFKAIAIQEMNLYGIPASVTIAQGLFESGNGNGDLARYANNHFGIKCTTDWKGEGYYKDDDRHNDCFRVYVNPEQSFRDHSDFLKRKRYAHLFELDKNDYQGWAQGLKDAGYATNPKYPQLLVNIIQKYNLDVYDRAETDIQKIKREDRVLTQINQNIGKAAKDSVINTTPVGKTYIVTTGDTLYAISRRFGLTVEDLKALNNMADNSIKIGQKLIISR